MTATTVQLVTILLVIAYASLVSRVKSATTSALRENMVRIARIVAIVKMVLLVIQSMANANAVQGGWANFASIGLALLDFSALIAKKHVNASRKIRNCAILGMETACVNLDGVTKHVPDLVLF